jgi:hypothetical protein
MVTTTTMMMRRVVVVIMMPRMMIKFTKHMQKRLILENVSEIYVIYSHISSRKLTILKIYRAVPTPLCIAGGSGARSVCVCVCVHHHQNVKRNDADLNQVTPAEDARIFQIMYLRLHTITIAFLLSLRMSLLPNTDSLQ